jgi:hypothetical protein
LPACLADPHSGREPRRLNMPVRRLNMPVRKTSRSSSATRESTRFDRRAAEQERSDRRRVIIKIVPEPQPTPSNQPVPSKEILRHHLPKKQD